jgi:plasmid stability protein
MRGDAGVREIVADALSAEGHPRDEAYAAALLDTLSNDPYAAVRFIARRSRQKLHVATISLFPIAVRDDRAIMIAE